MKHSTLLTTCVLTIPLTTIMMKTPAWAQAGDILAPLYLPTKFTVVYSVTCKDIRTEPMRKSETQSSQDYWRRLADKGKMPREQADKLIQADATEVMALQPTTKFQITVSADDNRLVCASKGKEAADNRVGLYSAETKKTYYMDMREGRPDVYVVKGFNYSAMCCIPLLAYKNPGMDLFLYKDRQPAKTAVNGADGLTLLGQSPYTFYGHASAVSQIPYVPSEVMLTHVTNGYEVRRCVNHDDADTYIASEWTYSRYAPAIGTMLPKRMTYRVYKTFTLNGIQKELPKTEYTYAFVSAQAKPLESAQFEIDYWLAGEKTAAIRGEGSGLKQSFLFNPSSTSLSNAISMQQQTESAQLADGTRKARKFPVMLAGLISVCAGWVLLRTRKKA